MEGGTWFPPHFMPWHHCCWPRSKEAPAAATVKEIEQNHPIEGTTPTCRRSDSSWDKHLNTCKTISLQFWHSGGEGFGKSQDCAGYVYLLRQSTQGRCKVNRFFVVCYLLHEQAEIPSRGRKATQIKQFTQQRKELNVSYHCR